MFSLHPRSYFNNWRMTDRPDDRAAAGKLCEEYGVQLLVLVIGSRGLLEQDTLKHYVKVSMANLG